jgi:hypothetical protein
LNLHIDQYLTNLAVGFFGDPQDWQADAIAPVVMVDKQSNKYPIWDAAALMRIQMGPRAAGDKANRMGFSLSNDSYFANNVAGALRLPFENFQNSDVALDKAAAAFMADQAKRSKEKLVIDAVLKATTWGTGSNDQAGHSSTAGTNQFVMFSTSGSTPYTVFRQWARTVQAASGRYPNRLLLTQDVADTVLEHPDTKAKINYVREGSLGYEDLTRLVFPRGNGKVIVTEGSYNSAAEGQSAVNAYFATKKAWMGFVNENPDSSGTSPSAIYQFVWRLPEMPPDSSGIYMLAPNDQNKAGDDHVRIYEGGYFVDAKITSAACGLYAYDCIA